MHVCDRKRESSCNSTAKICIEAECERQLHDYLTETCQINDVVSVITEIGSFYFQAYSTRVRCKDNNGVAVTCMTQCLPTFTGLG